MKRKFSLIVLGTLLVAGVFGGALFSTAANSDYSWAELKVSNLSCSSCVARIQTALSKVDGVGQVDVDITRGHAQVEFDAEIVTPKVIAATITKAGYPAEPLQTVEAKAYEAALKKQSAMALKYVGRIGERLVTNEEFAALVKQQTPSQAEVPPAAVKAAVWRELVQQELLLTDASKNKVVVQQGEVDLAVVEMREKMEDFDAKVVEQFGSLDAFNAFLKDRMVIEKNIETHVINGEEDPLKQRQMIDAWYGKLVQDTQVEVYDTELKAGGSGNCGGSGGCGGGSGACCSTKKG